MVAIRLVCSFAVGRQPEGAAEHQAAHHHLPMGQRFRPKDPGKAGKALCRLTAFGVLQRPHMVGVIERERQCLGQQDAAHDQGRHPLRQPVGDETAQHGVTSAAKT
jgi:hypothetical protein